MSIRPLLTLAASLLLLAGGGCSVFEDYPAACAEAVAAFRAGQFDQAAVHFAGEAGALGSNEFLALAEQGMARHVAGQLQQALDAWLEAAVVLEGFEDRPTVSGRSITEGILSLAINDKTLPYDGEGFEVALLHAFLAWDFLLLGDLNGAMVEVLKGYDLQRYEEERYGSHYGMNRFARFVAAIAQELDGAYDEAEIDLRRLAEELPQSEAVRYSLERVQGLQRGAAEEERGVAQLVVIFEQGQMPPKTPHELVYPTGRTFGRVSVPAFGPRRQEADAVAVSLDGTELGRTELLESVILNAEQNLADRIGWLTAKTIGRSAAKSAVIHEISKEVEEDHGQAAGAVVGILGGILSTLSERADLRSWLTLPVSVQALRAPVQPGTHDLVLELIDSDGSRHRLDLGPRDFRPGRPVFVSARSLGSRMWADAYGGSAPPQP